MKMQRESKAFASKFKDLRRVSFTSDEFNLCSLIPDSHI